MNKTHKGYSQKDLKSLGLAKLNSVNQASGTFVVNLAQNKLAGRQDQVLAKGMAKRGYQSHLCKIGDHQSCLEHAMYQQLVNAEKGFKKPKVISEINHAFSAMQRMQLTEGKHMRTAPKKKEN